MLVDWSGTLLEDRLVIALGLGLGGRRVLGVLGVGGLLEVTHQLVHDVYRDREDDGAVVLRGDAVEGLQVSELEEMVGHCLVGDISYLESGRTVYDHLSRVL